jgi:hypothetical protein
MSRILKMTAKRETKGAVLFEEVQDPEHENVLNTMYVRKTAFRGQVPKGIKVSLDW